MARPRSHTQFQVRTDGNFRAMGRVQSQFSNSILNSNGGVEGIGRFRRTNPPFFDSKIAPDSPSKKVAYREVSRRTPADQFYSGAGRGKRVPQCSGVSECDHLAESSGRRCYIRWRDIIRRCLYDVADDGAVIGCIKILISLAHRISVSHGTSERFGTGGLGELNSADLTHNFCYYTRGSSRIFLWHFYDKMASRKIRWPAVHSAR